MSSFSENLLNLRKQHKLSQQDAAERSGVAYRSYRRYEAGEREPNLSALVALADFYHVTLDELVGRTVPDLAEKE